MEWGEALEAVGEASMSLLSVLTIHAMSSYALARWGEAEAQQEWLPSLTSGAKLGGFCLTEPTIGCDAKSVTTRLEEAGDSWRVTGTKRWISAAELVDVFLVFGQTDQGPTAVLVPRETPGVTVTPISVRSEVRIWLTVCCRLCARLSMSLVTRLSRSPRDCLSM